jgi:hypothetical protein
VCLQVYGKWETHLLPPTIRPVLQPARTTRCAEAEDGDSGRGVRPDRGGLCACVVHGVCVEIGIESGCGSKSHDPKWGRKRHRPSRPWCTTPFPLPFLLSDVVIILIVRIAAGGRKRRRRRRRPPVRASALPAARAPSAPAPAATVDAGAGGGVRLRTD